LSAGARQRRRRFWHRRCSLKSVDYRGNDTDIAQAAVTALKWNALIPENRITLTVSSGWLTLNGTLDWQYQKEAAARAVRDLTGVKGVTNSITVKPQLQAGEVQAKIEAA
jgi:VCBS repeat-containing protein